MRDKCILSRYRITGNFPKLLVITVMLLFNCIAGKSQPRKIYFQSIKQGLSNQLIRGIIKDYKGFMWFGTQNGLTRYDGINFVIYENLTGDTNSLSYHNISYLYEDKDRNLWVGTFNGLNLYNREQNNFIQIKSFRKSVISSICEDNSGNLWLGTIGSGVARYNLKTNEIKYFSTDQQPELNTISAKHITCIAIDSRNRIWVGCWDGLFQLDEMGNIIHHFKKIPNNTECLSDNYVNSMSLDQDSILWIGTIYGGLNKLSINSENLSFKHYFSNPDKSPSPTILSLFSDNRNNLWVGIENIGLMRLQKSTGYYELFQREEGDPYTLNSNIIRSLYIDNLNILWVGTMGSGVNVMDERFNRFELYRKNISHESTIVGNDVHCFREDKAGNIWIATYDGISLFDVRKQQFTRTITKEKDGLTTNAVNSIVFDRDDNLWVGTLDKGIDMFDKHFVKKANFKIKGIQKVGENKINTLYIDKRNNLWAGTSGSGLFRYDRSNHNFVPVYDESQGVGPYDFGYIFSIYEASDSNLWVGTAYRLFRMKILSDNKYSYKIFSKGSTSDSIHSNNINSIFEDNRKNLWIGTLDQGLFRFNNQTESFISFSKQDGLPSNSIFGLLEDGKGKLWISTNKGLAEFDYITRKCRNFTTDDGLVSNEFTINCCLRSESGKFFFGSSEGFNSFFPDSIKDNRDNQPVCLTDFRIFNQSVPIGVKGSPLIRSIGETQKIVLKYNQSSFTIEFVALNYIHGSQSRYKYILEGLEDKWNEEYNKNSATYSYLKPGKYLFKVKGSNNDGIWNETPAILEIVILPPYWKSIWALIVYFLVCFALVYFIIHFRVSRAKEMHLAELNQMKLQFFANISHELRTPLSLIISPVENMLMFASKHLEIKDQLDMIHKNAHRLFRMVNEIMDFNKAEESKLTISVRCGDIARFTYDLANFFRDEATRRNINYKFESDPESISAWFDQDKYEKIILNVLSNAFKFTPDNGTIFIRLEERSQDKLDIKEKKLLHEGAAKKILKISIIDNGKGISPADINRIFDRFYQGSNQDYAHQTGTGIGLALTKSLVELHRGKIFATSEKGGETCFTILLPLGNKHFKKSEISASPVEIVTDLNKEGFIIDEANIHIFNTPLDAPTLLIVEDNFDLRKYVYSVLCDKYNIFEAGDGELGYQMAIEKVPDLIISDIIMPVLSGTELCKRIKGNIITSHIPVILLTAKSTMEDKIDGIDVGADSYIIKPFNIKYLEAVIKNLIETRKKLFQRFSQDVYILPKEMSKNQIDQHFLEKIITYVEENINKPELSVEDLASHLLMSPGHTWRKVKSLTGLPTNEFVRTIKLKKAIKIMEEGNLNISEIAYKVGFSSPAYFTKCFKEQYGKSPSAFIPKPKKRND